MTQVLIRRADKSVMQSGPGKSRWLLETPATPHNDTDPLTGHRRGPTKTPTLSFPDKDSAIAYAKANGLAFTLREHQPTQRAVKSYAANFAAKRKGPWTH